MTTTTPAPAEALAVRQAADALHDLELRDELDPAALAAALAAALGVLHDAEEAAADAAERAYWADPAREAEDEAERRSPAAWADWAAANGEGR